MINIQEPYYCVSDFFWSQASPKILPPGSRSLKSEVLPTENISKFCLKIYIFIQLTAKKWKNELHCFKCIPYNHRTHSNWMPLWVFTLNPAQTGQGLKPKCFSAAISGLGCWWYICHHSARMEEKPCSKLLLNMNFGLIFLPLVTQVIWSGSAVLWKTKVLRKKKTNN